LVKGTDWGLSVVETSPRSLIAAVALIAFVLRSSATRRRSSAGPDARPGLRIGQSRDVLTLASFSMLFLA